MIKVELLLASMTNNSLEERIDIQRALQILQLLTLSRSVTTLERLHPLQCIVAYVQSTMSCVSGETSTSMYLLNLTSFEALDDKFLFVTCQ